MSDSDLEELHEDVVDQFETCAKHLEAGGPNRVPHLWKNVEKSWEKVHEDLIANVELQQTLCQNYASAIEECDKSKFFYKQVPVRVKRSKHMASRAPGISM